MHVIGEYFAGLLLLFAHTPTMSFNVPTHNRLLYLGKMQNRVAITRFLLTPMKSTLKSPETGSWVKTGFVDGNTMLWYNNVTQEMSWRRLDMWNDAADFNLGVFVREYGAAYMLTASTLSALSYSFCYCVVVYSGLDVAAFLGASGSGANAAGSAALAFLMHKAASPVRLPLGVALTPLVANAVNSPDDDFQLPISGDGQPDRSSDSSE